jgi:hypothetical protein
MCSDWTGMPISQQSIVCCFLLSLLTPLLLLSGCNGGKSTSPGADSLTVEDSIRMFLTPALKDTLEKYGMVLHEGDTPPKIEGIFYAGKPRLKSSNIPGDAPFFGPMSLRFINARGRRIDVRQLMGGSKADADGAFVSGSDSQFTVCASVSSAIWFINQGVQYESVDCYSGRVTSSRITDFLYSTLVTKKGVDSLHLMIEAGQGRVIEESDSLAERVEDFPHTVR